MKQEGERAELKCPACPRENQSKPRTVLAYQLTRDVIEASLFDKVPWPEGVKMCSAAYHPGRRTISSIGLTVTTIHHQETNVAEGDWIIQEPDGIHHYPCKPDVFEQNYETARPTDGGEAERLRDALKSISTLSFENAEDGEIKTQCPEYFTQEWETKMLILSRVTLIEMLRDTFSYIAINKRTAAEALGGTNEQ